MFRIVHHILTSHYQYLLVKVCFSFWGTGSREVPSSFQFLVQLVLLQLGIIQKSLLKKKFAEIGFSGSVLRLKTTMPMYGQQDVSATDPSYGHGLIGTVQYGRSHVIKFNIVIIKLLSCTTYQHFKVLNSYMYLMAIFLWIQHISIRMNHSMLFPQTLPQT